MSISLYTRGSFEDSAKSAVSNTRITFVASVKSTVSNTRITLVNVLHFSLLIAQIYCRARDVFHAHFSRCSVRVSI